MNKITLIATLAQEIEIYDPIDWGYLNIQESEAYSLMAAYTIELLDKTQNNELTSQAIITKLLVENFVLNLRLLDYGK